MFEDEPNRAERLVLAMRRLTKGFPAPFTESRDNGGAARDFASLLLEVASKFGIAQVELGVEMILDGRFDGFDGKRLPTPTQLALAIRQACTEIDRRARLDARPALPPPDIPRDDASRQRVKAMTQRFAADQGRVLEASEREGSERYAALVERTRTRFAPSQEPEAVRERLLNRRMDSGAAR